MGNEYRITYNYIFIYIIHNVKRTLLKLICLSLKTNQSALVSTTSGKFEQEPMPFGILISSKYKSR